MEKLGSAEDMSLRLLTWKTAMLLSLVATTRVGEIKHLDIGRMSIPEEGNKVVFFSKEHSKTGDLSRSPEPLEIFRAASSSAKARGATIEDIMKRGNWSNKYTWQKYYNRNIVSAGRRFQEALLK